MPHFLQLSCRSESNAPKEFLDFKSSSIPRRSAISRRSANPRSLGPQSAQHLDEKECEESEESEYLPEEVPKEEREYLPEEVPSDKLLSEEVDSVHVLEGNRLVGLSQSKP